MRWVPLIFALGGILCAQDAPQTGTIHGVVTDEASGLPMRDVPVQVLQRRELQGYVFMETFVVGKVSDEQGRYVIANIPPGKPVIEVRVAKHRAVSHSTALSAGQNVEVNFSVPAIPRIAGRVLDEQRKPLKGASVWVIQSTYGFGKLRRSQAGYVSSDEDGRFVFDEKLDAGRAYYLLAKGPAGVPTFYGGSTSFEAAAPVVLGGGELREHTDIVLRTASTHCMDGKVKAGGKPLSTELTVEQSALEGANIPFGPRVETAADGRFRACGLASGDYTISGPDRHFHDEQSFTIADSEVHGIELNLDPVMIRREFAWDGDPPAEAPEEPAAAESTTRQNQLSLNVADLTDRQFRKQLGLPMGPEVVLLLNGVQFRAKIPYSDTAPVATTAGDLALSVHLAPGCYVKEITYGGVPVSDGMLHLSAGTGGTLRIVAAQGSGAIAAKVDDGEGHAASEAVVVVVPDRVEIAAQFAALARQADADPGGNFTSDTLAPGKYRVLALTRNYRPTEEDISKLLALLPSAQKVEIGRSGNVPVTLTVTALE